MISTRTIYTLPTLPTLGGAGYKFTDPIFGSRMVRLTDATYMAGHPNSSFTTPSASHQLMWNADSTRFSLGGAFGKCMPLNWNPTTMTASRLAGPGDGGLLVTSQIEVQWSFVDRDIIFISNNDPSNDWPIVQTYNVATLTKTTLLNLGTIAHITIPQHTYNGTILSSKASPEKVMTIFGGSGQDGHYLTAVFNVSDPTVCTVVDTVNSLLYINGAAGVATNITLGFHLHHSQIDFSGRYCTLETTSVDIGLGKAAKYIWDMQTNLIAPVTVLGGAHSCMGYRNWINQDGPSGGLPYDGVQWQYRDLSNIGVTRNLIVDPLRPQETYIDGHNSWNNAIDGGFAPMSTELYRSYDGPNDVPPHTQNTTPWRAWDNEIVSVDTGAFGASTQVWRHCHHRSIIRVDGDPAGQEQFWYQPRANISTDGKWIAFTSNWERTLGIEVTTGIHRQDTFIVEHLTNPLPTQDPTHRHTFF
jgi:hypothetical protein